jgi:DNA-binding NarL/FixJ family response regulator
VVATAGSVTPALAQAQLASPNIALVDAGLCLSGGAHLALANVKQMAPGVRVIMMDVLPGRDDIITFIEAGAHGIILNDATLDDVVGTIRSVAHGSDVVPPALTSLLWSCVTGDATGRTSAGRLTNRERDIQCLIAEGLANREIALRLNIGTHTVKTHVHHILEKLSLHSRVQIAVHAGRDRAPPESAVGAPH